MSTSITHARGADFLTHLQETGAARARRWHPTPEQEFTGLEWAGAMCGEAGEAANVAKKLRRVELSLAGNDKSERPALPPDLIANLGRELADTLIYMVNVASHYGVNLADATVEAFNNKSAEMGFPERIGRDSDYVASLENLALGIAYDGCFTGDCPHETASECIACLSKLSAEAQGIIQSAAPVVTSSSPEARS